MRKTVLNVVAFFCLSTTACSTWVYDAQPRIASVHPPLDTGYTIAIDYSEDLPRIAINNLSNNRIYLEWDGLAAVVDGLQVKVYKGSQVRVLAEASIPAQPIDAGATIVEAIVPPVYTRVYQDRPGTVWDYSLCWVYGIGCLIADQTWKPDEEYKLKIFPGAAPSAPLYDLMVPIRHSNGQVTIHKLTIDTAGIVARKK